MSDLSRAAQDLAEAALGEGAAVALEEAGSRWLALARRGGEVLALGGGGSPSAAYRMLIELLARRDRRPTTSEAARILGVDSSRVRRYHYAGLLEPEEPGRKNLDARYAPAEVYRFAQLPRSRGRPIVPRLERAI